MCSEFGNKSGRQSQHGGSPIRRLLDRFRATFDRIPAWAWPFVPSIPLIGRRYRPRKSLLIYASAENLSWLNMEPIPERFTSEDAWNRYRLQFDAVGRPADTFFPDVGIAPVSDGGLLVAGRFIAERVGLPTADEPRSFLEQIAVSNWCKFSIRTDGSNQDYIGDLRKLVVSLPFIVGELTELQPAVAMLPKAVWQQEALSLAMRGASPWTRFLPLPQFNSTVVNCHLGKWHGRGQELRRELAGEPLGIWMKHLRRMREENAWRYIAMLEEWVSNAG